MSKELKTPIILDGGVLLNLAAAGTVATLLGGGGYRGVLPAGIHLRPLRLWENIDAEERDGVVGDNRPHDAGTVGGVSETSPTTVRVEDLVVASQLDVVETSSCRHIALQLTGLLSDAAATTLALALATHGAALATDDRRVRRVVADLQLVLRLETTSSLVHLWQTATQAGAHDVSLIVRAINHGAQFTPWEDDPLQDWWLGHLAIT
jgi:hypothetical protein